MKKAVVNLAKIAISVALLSFLAWQGYQALRQDPEAFDKLVHQAKDWRFLAGALVVTLVAVVLSFCRWYLLVRALGLPFTLREAIRLGFVGYLLNFTLSVVGGDVIKSVAIAHRQPGRRTAAVATVVVDRIIGLYALFTVGAVASLFMPFDRLSGEQAAAALRVCQMTQILTLVGAVGFALVLLPGLTTLPLWEALGRIPKVGTAITAVMDSIRMYRRQPGLLALTLAISVGTHSLNAVAIYLLARAFQGEDPSLAANFIIAPIAMVGKAAPLPGGLGAFEGAFAFMYQALSPPGVYRVQGLVIALAFRVCELAVAFIGGVYYIVDRQQVRALMDEAKQEPATA